MHGIGAVSGLSAYVRTAGTNAAPGTVLRSAIAPWVAPGATFVLASAPAVANAVVSGHSTSQPPPDAWWGFGVGLTGAVVSGLCLIKTLDRPWTTKSFVPLAGFVTGVIGAGLNIATIMVPSVPLSPFDRQFGLWMNITSCVTTAVSVVLDRLAVRNRRI